MEFSRRFLTHRNWNYLGLFWTLDFNLLVNQRIRFCWFSRIFVCHGHWIWILDFMNDIGLFKNEVDWYWIFLDLLLDIER